MKTVSLIVHTTTVVVITLRFLPSCVYLPVLLFDVSVLTVYACYSMGYRSDR